jgi:hypothetical protein
MTKSQFCSIRLQVVYGVTSFEITVASTENLKIQGKDHLIQQWKINLSMLIFNLKFFCITQNTFTLKIIQIMKTGAWELVTEFTVKM